MSNFRFEQDSHKNVHSLAFPRGCARWGWRVTRRSQLLSCSEVHGVRSCALFSLVGLRRGARLGFWGVECAFFSPRPLFVTRESTRSFRDRVSSCRRRVSRRTASSDSRVCDFSFALAFGRLRSTRAREPLRVEAGCTPGPSSCAPSEHIPRPWFTLKPRRTSPSRPPRVLNTRFHKLFCECSPPHNADPGKPTTPATPTTGYMATTPSVRRPRPAPRPTGGTYRYEAKDAQIAAAKLRPSAEILGYMYILQLY